MIKNWRNTGLAVAANMRRACAPNPPLIELAPLTPSSPPLHGANTGRWRLIVGCLLPLQVSIHAASPAFSYTDNLDSYLASKFQLVAERQANQYVQYGRPSGMDVYYFPHPYTRGPHPFSSWCCNHTDCGFARPGSVTWTPDGYKVMLPDGKHQIVPENSPAIRYSYERGFENEHRAAACIMHKSAYSDEWLRQRTPGALESGSEWYVRCLYIGRSGQ